MAVHPVSSSANGAAHTVQQPRQQPKAPQAPNTNEQAPRVQAHQQQQTQHPQQTQQPQPVVNSQGQVTGKVVNTFA